MLIKILVADDSASDRLIIKNALEEYCVLTACDGVEAMRMLEEDDGINLLILDLDMPKMDGFQVLKSLKGDERFRKLRTIILTASDEPENESKGLKLGAADYIRKPIHVSPLKARIDVHVALLRAEQALAQQPGVKMLDIDMLLDQLPVGAAITRSSAPKCYEEVFVRINSLYEQITGRTREELISSSLAKITHPDDLEEEMRNSRRLRAGEIKVYSMDKRYIKPDGSIVWVHSIVATLTLANVQPGTYIRLDKDITNRKAVEEALHESERSKSVFLSHLPGLAYRCNYDRN